MARGVHVTNSDLGEYPTQVFNLANENGRSGPDYDWGVRYTNLWRALLLVAGLRSSKGATDVKNTFEVTVECIS